MIKEVEEQSGRFSLFGFIIQILKILSEEEDK